MSEYIEVGQPLQFTDPNTPTRVGEIVENVSDIYNIPSPRLGMQVFVKSEKKSFVITSLKNKVVGGVNVPEAAVETFEPVGAKAITWNNDTDPSNMNDFVVAGVYDIKGERTRIDDNLPILNTGSGHSFNARLTVLDSSISGDGKDDDKCITQVLSFSNRLGQGEVYIRTGKGSSLDSLAWEKWSTLQRNVNVGTVTSLDHLVDNGIYSGVYVKNDAVLETFVLVVINNYALAGINNSPKSISQFKYSVNLGGSFANYKSRVGTGVNDWGEWNILNKDEINSMISAEIKKVADGIDPNKIDSIKDIIAWIDAHGGEVTAIYNAIQENTDLISTEIERAASAESGLNQRIVYIETTSARYDGNAFSSTANDVKLITTGVNINKQHTVTLPAATTEKAGAMSAEDKKAVNGINDAIAEGERRALRKLFIAAGAEYNDGITDKTKTAPWGETVTHKAGYYYLNGLGDITEKQMMDIYNAGRIMSLYPCALFKNKNIRTNLISLLNGGEGKPIDLYYVCSWSQIEVFNQSTATIIQMSDLSNAFTGCSKLKYIRPVLSVQDVKNSWNFNKPFKDCSELVLCKLKNLKMSVAFSESIKISKESILYTITNATPTSAITITLHPDAYARLADDAEVVAALEAQPLITLVSA